MRKRTCFSIFRGRRRRFGDPLEPSLKKQSTEETEENDEPESELIKVSEEEDENGKKQFILKDLLDKGIYLVTAEFDQGTVEYGFEVKKERKILIKRNSRESC